MLQPADRGVCAILTTLLDVLVIVVAATSLVLALGAYTERSALVLLSAFGLARLFRRLGGGAAGVAFAVLCASVLTDLRPRLTLSEHWRVPPPIYASVTPDMVLAEFPMGQEANIAYMYFSTKHWARMLNDVALVSAGKWETLDGRFYAIR